MAEKQESAAEAIADGIGCLMFPLLMIAVFVGICAKVRDKNQYNKYTNERKIYLKEKSYLARERNRQFLLDFLLGRTCVDCGESDPIVLEFDHQGDKKNDVTRMAHCGCSIETLKKELSKCEIHCANCHRRKTARDFDWFRQRSSIGRAVDSGQKAYKL